MRVQQEIRVRTSRQLSQPLLPAPSELVPLRAGRINCGLYVNETRARFAPRESMQLLLLPARTNVGRALVCKLPVLRRRCLLSYSSYFRVDRCCSTAITINPIMSGPRTHDGV